MTSARATKLTFAVLSTAILMAVVAALLFATPHGAFAAEPERPTDLVATAVDHDTVSLTWSHPDPASVDHYQVLSRKQGSGAGKLTQVATSTTTSFQHDGLEPESTYIYRVKPVNSQGEEGQRSARAEATTPAEETPAPPVAPTPVPDPTPAPPQRSDDEGQGNTARASHNVLVTNSGETVDLTSASSAFLAQRFTTGPNASGYTIAEVGVFISNIGPTTTTVVSIRENDSSNTPGDLVATLTNPATFSNDALNTFTAPSNTTIDGESTHYWITVNDGLTSNRGSFRGTTGDGQTGETGWSIGNARLWRTSESSAWNTDSGNLVISVRGSARTSTASDDATLSDLELEDDSGTTITLSPSFVSGTTTYTAPVVNSVDEITIAPTVNDSNATYEVQNNSGTALTDSDTGTAGFQVALSVGANIIKVEVTAEDASTETYTVTVTRAMAATPIYEVLVSNTGQASADFATNAVDYGQAFTTGSETAGYTLDAIDIGYNDSSNTAFSASIWSTYALDKAPNAVLYSLTPPATFSPGNLTFTAPPNTTLTSGTTYIIMFALESAGGATVKRTATVNPDEDAGAAAGWSIANNYIFAISGGWGQNGAFGPLLVAVKGTVYAGSNDATLSALTVNDGTNDLTLTPTFVSGTYAYEADVGNAVTTVTLSDTLNDDTAEITGVTLGGTAIADTDLTDGITVPSLLVGDNEIVVTVTAEDASTQTYTVTVTRAAAATPTVSISADKTTAVFKQEGITYTLTRTGATTAALPVSVTLTQTKNFLATTELTKTVTIAAGQTTKNFNFAASSFQHFAVGETVEAGTLTATVQDGTNYDLGTTSAVDVAIVIGITVRIELASYTVDEADGTLSFAIIARTGAGAPQPSSATGSINVLAEDRSASNAVDFAFTDGAENFQPSEFSADGGVWQAESTYNVSITNDDLDEDDETFILALERGLAFLSYSLVDASGNSCGSKCTVTATIVDDDTAGVTVSKSAITIIEENTTGDTYTVVLDSQPTANVTITIGGQGAADITATPSPFTFTTTNWATAQTVTVTAGNDTDTVTDTHSLTHSAASSDAKYSGISIADVGVTVNDNDSTIPALSFDNINISVAEHDSQATLSVELSQASTVMVTVDYATSDNTAEAGDDYTETSGTLTFAPGETVKAIIVPILDDAIYETLERFNVTLSNPAGATLPAFPGAQINIALDESPPTASIPNVTVERGRRHHDPYPQPQPREQPQHAIPDTDLIHWRNSNARRGLRQLHLRRRSPYNRASRGHPSKPRHHHHRRHSPGEQRDDHHTLG